MSKRWDILHLLLKYLKNIWKQLAFLKCFFLCLFFFSSQLEKFKNMIPFDQMTIEDLNNTFPETKVDKVKNPYWPHKPIAEL